MRNDAESWEAVDRRAFAILAEHSGYPKRAPDSSRGIICKASFALQLRYIKPAQVLGKSFTE